MSRHDPFEEVERLIERLGREFGDASGGSAPVPAGLRRSPPLDLVEYDDEFVASVELPGFDAGDVSIEVTDDELRIEGERERETDARGDDERVVRRERRSERVARTVRLPGAVDRDAVAARMRNGVLTVTLPRAEPGESDARRIDVE